MYLNRVTLYGNLTRDPEIKSIPNGTKVVNISMATNRTWKDQSGAKREEVEYHNVVAFAKQAEVIAQYCTKGSPLYVEGRIKTRSWDDANGAKKYRTEIMLENFQFGPKGGASSGSYAPSAQGNSAPASTGSSKQDDDLESIEYPDDDVNIDDIPF
ncbi:MAG: single-stranded DNA-binding protein [bacterium]